MRMQFQSLALLRSGIAVSCGIGPRCSLNLALLWLWNRLVAVAPIRTIAGKSSYDMSVALKRKKKKFFKYFRKEGSRVAWGWRDPKSLLRFLG